MTRANARRLVRGGYLAGLALIAIQRVTLPVVVAAQQRSTAVVIHAARVLDVKTGAVMTDQALVIGNGQIVSVGPAAKAALPADATRIELGAVTVLPGLIDVHTHLTREIGERLATPFISVPREALLGAKFARVTLLAGFTTVRNLSAVGYSDVALRDAIDAGDVAGPRMLVSGPPLSITGGQCDNNQLPPEFQATALGVADGVAAVQHRIRENIKYGADVLKVCATGPALGGRAGASQQSQYSREELNVIVAESHRLGRKVAVHAHGAEAIWWAAEAGADSIEHGTLIDERGIAAMKSRGTYLVPTSFVAEWTSSSPQVVPAAMAARARDLVAVEHQNIGRALAAGVKVAFGTDSGVYPHGLNARQFATMANLGMTPLQAIQSATVNAADLLGLAGRIGVLEAGARADIIAVDGDPLRDITALQRVRFVMKGGDIVTRP